MRQRESAAAPLFDRNVSYCVNFFRCNLIYTVLSEDEGHAVMSEVCFPELVCLLGTAEPQGVEAQTLELTQGFRQTHLFGRCEQGHAPVGPSLQLRNADLFVPRSRAQATKHQQEGHTKKGTYSQCCSHGTWRRLQKDCHGTTTWLFQLCEEGIPALAEQLPEVRTLGLRASTHLDLGRRRVPQQAARRPHAPCGPSCSARTAGRQEGQCPRKQKSHGR